ncbi:hypothetical protein [Lysinibacter sp. HNR]|uniref:hypothetical protein n=1 Tax=Lysinibacter sp. HNR TaxID=3031408 RepID=UPI002435629E|nr:hypothetical protein [Lysinibacter sp. HNR]WGD38538.1 hypothetical protein FrondiHNR_06435 [Lysinibacter sp. HNR]
MHNGAVRVQTIINSPSSTHEFSYGIGEGFQPTFAEDGSMWVVGFNSDGAFKAFSVGDAWARDANGKEVSTFYEIRGTELVQIVEPTSDTAYPIIADPTWQWYNAAYGAGFSKKETRDLASLTTAGFFCGALPKSPIQVACYVSFGYYFTQATLAKNANGCVFIAAVPAPIAMRWMSPECR